MTEINVYKNICRRPEAPHLLAACGLRVPAVHLPCQVLQGAGRPRLHHGASRSGDARHGGQVRPGHSNTLMAGCYRQFMLVDSKNKLITARVYPHMVLIEVSLSDGQLKLSYPGMTEITLSVPTGAVTCSDNYAVFSESVSGYDLGDEVGAWLSEVVLCDPDGGVRLIFHPKELSTRPDKIHNAVSPNMEAKDKPYFADTFAYMMLSQSSVAGLNQLLRAESFKSISKVNGYIQTFGLNTIRNQS